MSALPGHAQLAFIPAASEEKAKWILDHVTPINAQLYEEELVTSTFLWTIRDDDERKMILVFELYKDRDALENIHFKGSQYFAIRKLLATPGVLDGKIKLENALPVTGYLIRPGDSDNGDHGNEYIRSGNLRVKSGAIDSVIAAIKDHVSLFLSSEPEILSFIAFQSLEEADTITTWERYTSKSAFDESTKKGSGYAKFMEKIDSLVEVEGMTGYQAVGGYLSRDRQ